MLIYYISMLSQGVSILPSLFRVGEYIVYFWSNENNETIHVHVGKGKPSANATKIWLTASGGCIIANNGSRIPRNELNELVDIIAAQYFMICAEWKNHFKVSDIRFYC